MAAPTTSIFGIQIPQDKYKLCINTGILSALMINTMGMATIAYRNMIGNVDAQTGLALGALPYLGARLIKQWVPVDEVGLYVGTATGAATVIGVRMLLEDPQRAYFAGIVVADASAATVAAFRARVQQDRR